MGREWDKIVPEAVGLKLNRVDKAGRHTACETAIFDNGRSAVCLTLHRASLSGAVEVDPPGSLGSHFADVYINPDEWVQSVRLDAGSYRALKTHWMRCKVERFNP